MVRGVSYWNVRVNNAFLTASLVPSYSILNWVSLDE